MPVPTAFASYAKAGFARASAKDAAFSNRSAGSFSSPLISAPSTFAGTVRRSIVMGATSAVSTRTRTAWAVGAGKGGWPASIS